MSEVQQGSTKFSEEIPPVRPGLQSPLSDYLQRPEPTFGWKEKGRQPQAGGGQIIHLELYSQVWQGIPWKHQLLVILPGSVGRDAGNEAAPVMLYVTGSYDGGATAQFLTYFAEGAGAITAVLYDVPNQPLFDGLSEDALIAYSFLRYLETGDAAWPLLFPMVKTVAAAMTALQQLAPGPDNLPASQFIVTGGSKRGWTSWLVGAVDGRVCAIAPMVYNNLNLPAQARRQLDSWDAYSEEISDYVDAGLMEQMRTEEGQRLIWMVDPYSFREQLTLPKLIINGTNDRYWPLDAASCYFDDLPGQKSLLYVPNAGHGLEDVNRVGRATAAFYKAIASRRPLPILQAHFSGHNWDCTMSVESDEKPLSVKAWMASASTGDFRSSRWNSHPMTPDGERSRYQTRLPSSGHIALFAEAEYEIEEIRYFLSSPLAIVPSIPERRE